MTTTAAEIRPVDDLVMTMDAEAFVTQLETCVSLFDLNQLRERLEVLDALELRFGDPETFGENPDARIHRRAAAIRRRLETVNAGLFESIRSEIRHGGHPASLLRWMRDSHGWDNDEFPAPGLGFDFRDELVSGILQLREPCEANLDRVPERMFYQPTPVRHILRLIRASGLTADDVLVDLGSGLGHVSLLASMLAGVRSLGIEVEAAYVASARECAESLNRARVEFIHEDARAADLSSGSVFYLYSPFTGSILADVLVRLSEESTRRPIRICSLGPCTCVVAKESWVTARTWPDPRQVTVFESSQLCVMRRGPGGGWNRGWGGRSWCR